MTVRLHELRPSRDEPGDGADGTERLGGGGIANRLGNRLGFHLSREPLRKPRQSFALFEDHLELRPRFRGYPTLGYAAFKS